MWWFMNRSVCFIYNFLMSTPTIGFDKFLCWNGFSQPFAAFKVVGSKIWLESPVFWIGTNRNTVVLVGKKQTDWIRIYLYRSPASMNVFDWLLKCLECVGDVRCTPRFVSCKCFKASFLPGAFGPSSSSVGIPKKTWEAGRFFPIKTK